MINISPLSSVRFEGTSQLKPAHSNVSSKPSQSLAFAAVSLDALKANFIAFKGESPPVDHRAIIAKFDENTTQVFDRAKEIAKEMGSKVLSSSIVVKAYCVLAREAIKADNMDALPEYLNKLVAQYKYPDWTNESPENLERYKSVRQRDIDAFEVTDQQKVNVLKVLHDIEQNLDKEIASQPKGDLKFLTEGLVNSLVMAEKFTNERGDSEGKIADIDLLNGIRDGDDREASMLAINALFLLDELKDMDLSKYFD